MTLQAIESGETKAGVFAVRLRLQDGHKRFSHMFVIGTRQDPLAELPETWLRSVQARRLKWILKHGTNIRLPKNRLPRIHKSKRINNVAVEAWLRNSK